jgi:site-specific recombinase XerD
MALQCIGKAEVLVQAFEQYLRSSRGAAEETCRGYIRYVREFLTACFGRDRVDVRKLGPSDVVEFVTAKSTHLQPRSIQQVATALRALFRFLRVEGVCDPRLVDAVPTVAAWKLSVLPRSLTEEQLRQLLASLEGSTTRGRRDRAIVLCLSTLGLRAGEVAGLHLEDLDWRAGTVHIRTRKTGRGAVLPLPHDLGRAIVAYLRSGRPPTPQRHLFVVHLDAGGPMTSRAVRDVVRRALQSAGIVAPTMGSHVLRHTLATRLVRRGASLKEIADLFGHRSLDTTAIYAKVDLPSLSDVALPWPEVAP